MIYFNGVTNVKKLSEESEKIWHTIEIVLE